MIRVLAVDDDPHIRTLVELLLSTETDVELVGTAVTADSAISLTRELGPDVVLLDHQLEGRRTGLDIAGELKAASPTPIVLLCSAQDLQHEAAREPAVDAWLPKSSLIELVEVVRRLMAS